MTLCTQSIPEEPTWCKNLKYIVKLIFLCNVSYFYLNIFFICRTKYALPYLKNSKKNPHILNISPPLNMRPRWFRDHCAYTMAKYGMSMCVLGMAEEFKDFGIGVNALWPRTGMRIQKWKSPGIFN